MLPERPNGTGSRGQDAPLLARAISSLSSMFWGTARTPDAAAPRRARAEARADDIQPHHHSQGNAEVASRRGPRVPGDSLDDTADAYWAAPGTSRSAALLDATRRELGVLKSDALTSIGREQQQRQRQIFDRIAVIINRLVNAECKEPWAQERRTALVAQAQEVQAALLRATGPSQQAAQAARCDGACDDRRRRDRDAHDAEEERFQRRPPRAEAASSRTTPPPVKPQDPTLAPRERLGELRARLDRLAAAVRDGSLDRERAVSKLQLLLESVDAVAVPAATPRTEELLKAKGALAAAVTTLQYDTQLASSKDPIAARLRTCRERLAELCETAAAPGLPLDRRRGLYEQAMRLVYELDDLAGLPANLKGIRKATVRDAMGLQDRLKLGLK